MTSSSSLTVFFQSLVADGAFARALAEHGFTDAEAQRCFQQAQIELGRAAATSLAGHFPEAMAGSTASIACFGPPGQAEAHFELAHHGWVFQKLDYLGASAARHQATGRARHFSCAALNLLLTSEGRVGRPASSLLLAWARRRAFPVDSPLAGNWGRDGARETLLGAASSRGWFEWTRELLSLDLNPDSVDSRGWTPLRACAHELALGAERGFPIHHEGMGKCCELLLAAGANPLATAADGLSPIDALGYAQGCACALLRSQGERLALAALGPKPASRSTKTL